MALRKYPEPLDRRNIQNCCQGLFTFQCSPNPTGVHGLLLLRGELPPMKRQTQRIENGAMCCGTQTSTLLSEHYILGLHLSLRYVHSKYFQVTIIHLFFLRGPYVIIFSPNHSSPFCKMAVFCQESPMWLLDRGYDYEAWQVLQRISRINGKESFRCALSVL